MWVQYYQPLVTDLVQKALVSVCKENLPFTGKLEIDGIVCITTGSIDKQIVVKVHEVIGANGPEIGSPLNLGSPKRKLVSNPLEEQEKAKKQRWSDSVPLNLSHSETPANKNPVQSERQLPPSSQNVSLLRLLHEKPTNAEAKLKLTKPVKSPTENKIAANPSDKTVTTREVPKSAKLPKENQAAVSSSDKTEAVKEMSCRVCGSTFKSVQMLQLHTTSVHRRYLCKYCYNTFSLRCNLNRHERLHSGVKPFVCYICNRSFARNTDLRLHIQKHGGETADPNTSPDAAMKCEKCQKNFPDKKALLFHMFKAHKEQNGIHACTICEMVFDSEVESNKHWQFHAASLQQHGKIEVSPRSLLKNTPTSLKPVDQSVIKIEPQSPTMLLVDKPYKSLLPRTMTTQIKKEQAQELEVKQELVSQPQESAKTYDEEAATDASYGMDMDAIKKEFGPLFGYSEEEEENEDEKEYGESFSASSGKSSFDEMPEMDEIPAAVETSVRNKRKSQPYRVVPTDNEDIVNDSMEREVQSSQSMPKPVSSISPLQVHDKTSPSQKKLSEQTTNALLNNYNVVDEFNRNVGNSPTLSPDRGNTPTGKAKQADKGQSSPGLDFLADDDQSYVCQYGGCGQTIQTFKAFEDHYLSMHSRYPCKLCDQSFTCKNNRTRHIRNNHLGIAKKHECNHCKKMFSRPDTLQEHKFIHTASYKHDQCNICGASFERKAVLLSHIKKCFKNKYDLLEKELIEDLMENGEAV